MGNGGYYSKVSGKKWVTTKPGSPLEKTKTTTFKNNQRDASEGTTRRAPMDYFERKLDDKRRLTMPTELRKEFASGVVLTRGFGHYLHLYPQTVWEREVEPALQGSILDEEVANLNVKFRRGKTAVELDQKQGRVVIEQHLLEYADISHDIVAVRAGAYWRLMAPEAVEA